MGSLNPKRSSITIPSLHTTPDNIQVKNARRIFRPYKFPSDTTFRSKLAHFNQELTHVFADWSEKLTKNKDRGSSRGRIKTDLKNQQTSCTKQ